MNWVLDPFMGIGDVGWSCKKKGRRFIGFETDKDQMLLAMKRVDNCWYEYLYLKPKCSVIDL